MNDKQSKNTYFAACNSKNGFYSLFEEIFFSDPDRTVYILKGGPGTGKSFFMKKIASEAEKRGYTADRYLCSSDTDSLDAITVHELAVSVIDGTSPHAADPICPGACECIVNLGDFFNTEYLKENKDQILSLNRKKSAYYKTAYAYLSACGELYEIYSRGVFPALLSEKLNASAKRESSAYRPKSHRRTIEKRFISALGTRGEVSTDAFMHAKKLNAINDCLGMGHMYIEALARFLTADGISLVLCPDPLSPDRLEGVYLPDHSAFYRVIKETDERFGRIINCRRFVDKKMIDASMAKLRFAKKSADSLKNEALVNLKYAGQIHAELEKIYTAAMDFSKKEKFTESFTEKLFRPR